MGYPQLTLAQPAADDKLAIFRHLVGIHSTRSFAPSTSAGILPDLSHNNLHFDGRAAPNLGIYNRIVHREQAAKRGYKFASILINSCLGIQVIVAAALTAMGAANSSHVSITAFGAINTVIAGILTYLKGSGLPSRIRYYENEWKKVREYIEQRERDFSRPNCTLDVYEVVGVVEAMYEEVKADIQTNRPDNYVSVGEIRNRATTTTYPQIPKLSNLTGTMGAQEKKFKELEMKYGHKITEFLDGLARKEEERLKTIEGELRARKEQMGQKAEAFEKDIEARGTRFVELEKEAEKGIAAKGSMLVDFERDVEKEGERTGGNLARLGREAQDEIRFHGRG